MITSEQIRIATIEAASQIPGATIEGNVIDMGEFFLVPTAGIEEEETIFETIRRERIGYVVGQVIAEYPTDGIGPEGDDCMLDESGSPVGEPHWYATLPAAYIALRGFQAQADAYRLTESWGSPGPIIDAT